MKKAMVFLRGSILALLALLALAFLMSLGLLISGIELNINNAFIAMYSYGGSSNVYIKDIPTILAFVAGGVLSLNRYNKKHEDQSDVEN